MQHTPTIPPWARRPARALALAAGVLLASCGGSDRPEAVDVRIVHSFDGHDAGPYLPASGLTPAPDGHFYGLTTWGGTLDRGTLYRLTPDEKVERLHSFQDGADGALPYGSEMVLADGGRSLYGTTNYTMEGPSTSFRWSLGGGFTSFGYLGTVRQDYSDGLVAGSDGNLYGATDREWMRITPEGVQTGFLYPLPHFWFMDSMVAGDGGTFALVWHQSGAPHALEFLSHQGEVTSLFSFGEDTPVGDHPMGLERARDGTMRGYTRRGGAHGHGTFFRATTAGVVTKLIDLPKPLCGTLTEASDGRWYTFVCEEGAHAVARITPDGSFTVIYTFSDPEFFPEALVEHQPNRFYGVSLHGGALGLGAIFELVIAP